MAEAIFWGAIGLVVYVYAGFPSSSSCSRGRSRVRCGRGRRRFHGLVRHAAYNEEGSIAKKLANTFALDYPADRLRSSSSPTARATGPRRSCGPRDASA
jgi:hypothetical protein